MRALLAWCFVRRLAMAAAVLASLALPAFATTLPVAPPPCHEAKLVDPPASLHAGHATPAADHDEDRPADHGPPVHACCTLACLVVPPLLGSGMSADLPAALWDEAEPPLLTGEVPVLPDPPPRSFS